MARKRTTIGRPPKPESQKVRKYLVTLSSEQWHAAEALGHVPSLLRALLDIAVQNRALAAQASSAASRPRKAS